MGIFSRFRRRQSDASTEAGAATTVAAESDTAEPVDEAVTDGAVTAEETAKTAPGQDGPTDRSDAPAADAGSAEEKGGAASASDADAAAADTEADTDASDKGDDAAAADGADDDAAPAAESSGIPRQQSAGAAADSDAGENARN